MAGWVPTDDLPVFGILKRLGICMSCLNKLRTPCSIDAGVPNLFGLVPQPNFISWSRCLGGPGARRRMRPGSRPINRFRRVSDWLLLRSRRGHSKADLLHHSQEIDKHLVFDDPPPATRYTEAHTELVFVPLGGAPVVGDGAVWVPPPVPQIAL